MLDEQKTRELVAVALNNGWIRRGVAAAPVNVVKDKKQASMARAQEVRLAKVATRRSNIGSSRYYSADGRAVEVPDLPSPPT